MKKFDFSKFDKQEFSENLANKNITFAIDKFIFDGQYVNFDRADYEADMNNIRFYGDYVTVTDNTISFILEDVKGYFNNSHQEVLLENAVKKGRITIDLVDRYGIIFPNLHLLIDTIKLQEKLKNTSGNINIWSVLKSNIIVCEVEVVNIEVINSRSL